MSEAALNTSSSSFTASRGCEPIMFYAGKKYCAVNRIRHQPFRPMEEYKRFKFHTSAISLARTYRRPQLSVISHYFNLTMLKIIFDVFINDLCLVMICVLMMLISQQCPQKQMVKNVDRMFNY